MPILTSVSLPELQDIIMGYAEEDPRLIMIDFSASWCGPCRKIGPYIEALVEKYAENLRVIAIDVDEYEDIAERFHIISLPTFVFYHGGAEIDRIVGANPDAIEEKIIQYLT